VVCDHRTTLGLLVTDAAVSYLGGRLSRPLALGVLSDLGSVVDPAEAVGVVSSSTPDDRTHTSWARHQEAAFTTTGSPLRMASEVVPQAVAQR
jgi:hypothetical protein